MASMKYVGAASQVGATDFSSIVASWICTCLIFENPGLRDSCVLIEQDHWPGGWICLQSSMENSFRVIPRAVKRIGDSTNCESSSESISLFSERKKSTRQ